MKKEAIYHRPKNNYAYAYNEQTLHIRLRTKKGDVTRVTLISGDPYDWKNGEWQTIRKDMYVERSDSLFDYWLVAVKPEFKRLRYGFELTDEKKETQNETKIQCDTEILTERPDRSGIPRKNETLNAGMWDDDGNAPRILNNKNETISQAKDQNEMGILDETNDPTEHPGEAETLIYTERGFFEHLPLDDTGYYFCFPYLNKADIFIPPEWTKHTIWYQIFPDRFANGDVSNDPNGTLPWGSAEPSPDNYFGGDLQGVIDHLDYLTDLGITGIYFTPIFRAYSNHKYDTIDYMELDPAFGDEKTLRQLVDACHKRGIRVMLDAVFNHSGYHFPPFQDVLEKGVDSSYKDWFHIHDFPVEHLPKPNYDTFAFTGNMPKLNTENPDVKAYLLEVARYWVEEFDIDGWRLDVANEVDHAFWRAFRTTVKSVKPDVYILGEIWHDAMPWLEGDEFDAVMNYPFTNSTIQFFSGETMKPSTFRNNINEVLAMYPANVNEVAFNLLDSHDTARILTLANGNINRVKLLYLFQMTFIGAPCIYYGDEIGMTGENDPGCRACMIWDETEQNIDLFHYVQALIRLRKSHPAFGTGLDKEGKLIHRTGEGERGPIHADTYQWTGTANFVSEYENTHVDTPIRTGTTFHFLQANDSNGTIVYERSHAGVQLIFAVNNSAVHASVNIPQLTNGALEVVLDRDVSQGEKQRDAYGSTLVELEAYGFRIFELDDD